MLQFVLQKCKSTTLRKETFAKENFAERIFWELFFEIYNLIRKNFFHKNDLKIFSYEKRNNFQRKQTAYDLQKNIQKPHKEILWNFHSGLTNQELLILI